MSFRDIALWRSLPAVAFAPALLLTFGMLDVFASGVSERAEPIILGAHVFALLAAAVIALRLLSGPAVSLRVFLPALPALVLALWSFGVASVRGTPMVGLFGTPQSGLGVLWYVDLALWLVLAGLALESPFWWRRLTEFCAIANACIAVLIAGQFYNLSPLLFIGVSWPALALPFMLLAHPGGKRWRLRIGLVLAAALMFLLATRSVAFILTAGMAVVLCGIVWRWGARLPLLRSRLFGTGLALLGAMVPLVLLASGVAADFGASMRSRVLTMQMVLARLHDSWDIWLFGLGWGRIAEAFALHLTAAQAPLWDKANWDFLFRDFFHSHNLLIETTLAAGLPGMLLALVIPMVPIWLAPASKRPYAAIFSFSWLLAYGVWLELLNALPVFAMAVVALCHEESGAPVVSRPRWRYAGATLAVSLAALLCYAIAMLSLQMSSVDRLKAWLKAPQGNAPELIDIRGDDDVVVAQVSTTIFLMMRRAEEGRPDPLAVDQQRFSWMIAMLESRMEKTRNPGLPIVANNVLTPLALDPQFEPFRRANEAALGRWPRWLDIALTLAPERNDVLVPYLTWRFNVGDHRETLLWARRLLAHNPDDPVGLYFQGGVYVQQPDTRQQQQGLILLRRSLQNGIERYIQLDENLKAQLRALPG